jgi:hypothetical protein
MVDEKVVGDGQLKPGAPRPLGQVVKIEEPQREPLVEPTDRVLDRPLHELAEPRHSLHSQTLTPVASMI